MRGTGALFFGESECLVNSRRNVLAADNLLGVLGQRPHHVDDIDDLKVTLLARLDRFLPGDHEHRHGAELRVRRSGYEVRRSGAECREADASLAGQSAVCRGHEASGLLVASQGELDLGSRQRLQEVEIFLAGDSEDELDAFLFESLHEEV